MVMHKYDAYTPKLKIPEKLLKPTVVSHMNVYVIFEVNIIT